MSCTEYDYVYIVHCHHNEYTCRNVNYVVNSIHNYEHQATNQDNLLAIRNSCQLTKTQACMYIYMDAPMLCYQLRSNLMSNE